MKASTRKFEIKFNRAKNRIERKGLRIFRAMFREMYNDFLEVATSRPPQMWLDSIKVNEDLVWQKFLQFYSMNANLALMVRENIANEKQDPDDVMWINIFQDKMRDIVRNEAGDKIVSIVNTTEDEFKKVVREVLTVGEAEGLGIPEISETLRKEIGRNLRGNAYARARAIAQTEMISASNRASQEAAMSTGFRMRKFWSTSGLSNVRDSHLQAEADSMGGIEMNEAFSNGLMYPGDPNGPPEEVINCYLPDTEIKTIAVGAQKSFYSGNVIAIKTRMGKRLTITPNHHIVTEKGFVRAKDINVGDNLFCHTENIHFNRRMFGFGNNKYNKITFADEIFQTFASIFRTKRFPIRHLDFDGDGRFMNGNVDVIDANIKLLRNIVSFFKNIKYFRFKKTYTETFLIKRFSSLNLSFDRMFFKPRSFMGFLNLAFSLCGIHFRPFQPLRFGITSDMDSLFTKMPYQRNTWNSAIITKLLHAHSAFVHLDEVIEVRNVEFSGHVYDFTSLTNTNIANNIYTANCRCTILHEPVR